eukprot:8892448-Alexandrium_andersonii.AAC.1
MLRKVVTGYNKVGHSALTGAAPEEVAGNDDLTYFLQRRNAQDRQKNAAWRESKEGRLRELGAFRTL